MQHPRKPPPSESHFSLYLHPTVPSPIAYSLAYITFFPPVTYYTWPTPPPFFPTTGHTHKHILT